MCLAFVPEVDIGSGAGCGDAGAAVGVVRGLLGRLRAVFDEALALDLRGLDPGAVDEWVIGLQPVRAQLDALVCSAAAEADNAGIAARHQMFSTASAIAAAARCARSVIKADLRLGWWLLAHDTVAGALATGRLTRAHVEELVAATNPRTRDRMIDDQALLCDLATTLDFKQFCHAVQYWKNAADPDGIEPREQVARRSHSWKIQPDGSVHGSYRLDPVAGHALLEQLERDIERLRRHDLDTGFECTPTQRAADALVALVARGARSKTMAAPLVHYAMSDRVAAAMTSRLLGDTDVDLPLDWDDVDGRCEFADGTPLHPHFAMALLATATLRRLVLGADGEIRDLGRSVHGFPAHLRQALLTRARGRCEHIPGCDAPASWLQADHLIPWARGGTTTITNAQMACRPHNMQKSDHLPGG